MNWIRALIVVGLAGGVYTYWKDHHQATAQVDAGPAVSANGFALLPPVESQHSSTVYVVAAQNCPHAEAQRADRLAEDLSRKGVRVERIQDISFSLSGPPDSTVMERMNRIMNGPLPVVFVNGRAKSNPSLDEVVAEFRAGSK